MPDGKWITGLTPELPIANAARLVLPARLGAVLEHLPLAIESAARDPEHVHQLRVATRRATAALKLFEDCLPAKHERALRRSLRALRQAAGAARDWDVFRKMLEQAAALQPVSAKAARDFLFGMVAARRADAQAQLIAARDHGEHLERELMQLNNKSFDWRDGGSQTAGKFAVSRIGSLLDEFNNAATPPPGVYEELHRLRIFGKRLRYSMEVFADCFQPPLREQLYPAIEETQDILGQITDAHVAMDRFIQIRQHIKSFQPTEWPHYRKPIEQLLLAQRRVLPRERKRFLKWLANWRKRTSDWPLRKLAK